MNIHDHIQTVFKTASCLHNQLSIEKAFDEMAEQMTQHSLSQECPIFLGVAVGGLLPLSSLVLRLKFPLEIDFAQISSYKDKMYASELVWKTKPQLPLKDRTIVIVDDILDKGLTLAELVRYCNNEGAKSVLTAVLINKQVQRSENGLPSADFVGLNVDNRFVFGYGLDYKGYLRNVPGIYEPADEFKK